MEQRLIDAFLHHEGIDLNDSEYKNAIIKEDADDNLVFINNDYVKVVRIVSEENSDNILGEWLEEQESYLYHPLLDGMVEYINWDLFKSDMSDSDEAFNDYDQFDVDGIYYLIKTVYECK